MAGGGDDVDCGFAEGDAGLFFGEDVEVGYARVWSDDPAGPAVFELGDAADVVVMVVCYEDGGEDEVLLLEFVADECGVGGVDDEGFAGFVADEVDEVVFEGGDGCYLYHGATVEGVDS